MNNWKKYKLGEICDKIQYGYTASAENKPVGPKFLRITDIQNHEVDWLKIPYCKIDDKDISKYKLKIGDICIARTGASTGVSYMVKEEINAIFASYLIRYELNKNITNPSYIDFLLRSSDWKNYVNSIIGGSAQPGANAQQFADFEFDLPNIETQTRITNFLSQFDDKIELNRQMNYNLEELADTYFKRHFFVNKINSDSLGELITEKTESVKNENLEQVQILSAVKSGDLINSEEYFTKQVFSQNISKYKKVTLWDFAYNPARINIGSIGMLNRDILGGVSPVYTVFRAKKGYEHFMNLLIKQNFTKKQIENLCFGGVRQVLRFSDLASIQIPIPTETEIKEFNTFYLPLLAKIESNKNQNETLANYRDSILPKLMSGEIEI